MTLPDDGLELFDRDDLHTVRRSPRQRRSRRRLSWFGTGVVFAGLVLLAWYGMGQLIGIGGYNDYSGPGGADVLIEVQDGQSQREIAAQLADKDVVASSRAYIAAAEDNDRAMAVQPGFYVLKTKISGQQAVNTITSPGARVGNLQIKPGTRLDDVHQPNGSVTSGVLSMIAKASCATLNGHSTCVSADSLRQTVQSADLAALGVPSWAAQNAAHVDPAHRLEGLVLPGVYEVRPGDSPEQLLKEVLTASSAKMSSAGLPDIANGTGFTPYDVLKVASLVQSEGIPKDFGKVARVIYNRLAQQQKLELDSTVNYVLDRPEIRTSPADRAKAGPYNTYANNGMPPSPISAPSADAISAAAKPAAGNWLFFVKCETDGSSCFAVTDAEHQANVKSAQDRGVY